MILTTVTYVTAYDAQNSFTAIDVDRPEDLMGFQIAGA